ncbi:MAG: DUF4145 domain-containing protein [Nitrospirae bacterium]|nr:DUF4145 domain-containing protein [Nitrospirota bacterium]
MADNGDPQIGTTKKITCNQCKYATHHTLKALHTQLYTEEDFEGDVGYWAETKYLFWVCAGCDTAVLEEQITDIVNVDQHGEHIVDVRFSPKRSAYDLTEKSFKSLPRKLKQVYRESIQAFNNQLYTLTAAGLRGLIEGICADKNISGSNLKKRIDGLTAHLPKNIVENLHGFRFMGNDAVHELTTPSRHDLQVAIEVIEDLLNYLYELNYKASRLKKHLRVEHQPGEQEAG